MTLPRVRVVLDLMLSRHLLSLIVLGLAVGAGACSSAKGEPQLASSAAHPGYAVRFVDELHDARNRFMTAETESARLSQEFSGYPDQLKDPSWQHVGLAVQRADEAGRSDDYVRAHEQALDVAEFFEEEKDPIGKKVGGATQYVAKKKGCDVDTVGPAVHALGKAVEKSIEERVQESNPAHQLVVNYESAFKKENVETMKKQIDEITSASYYANVAIVRSKQRIARLLDEVDSVKATLESEIEDAKKAVEEAPDEPAKKSARDRQSRAIKAKSAIDAQVGPAKSLLSQADDRAAETQRKYQEALDALKKAIADQGGSAQ